MTKLTPIEQWRAAAAGNGKNKYNAKPKVYNGKRYASTKEANFRIGLDMSTYAEDPDIRPVKIEDQVVYQLEVNGILITSYILDFKITYASGRVRYVDVKGSKKGQAYRTFTIKKNLMLAIHGIYVEEV